MPKNAYFDANIEVSGNLTVLGNMAVESDCICSILRKMLIDAGWTPPPNETFYEEYQQRRESRYE
jgi:hypothetical protein